MHDIHRLADYHSWAFNFFVGLEQGKLVPTLLDDLLDGLPGLVAGSLDELLELCEVRQLVHMRVRSG